VLRGAALPLSLGNAGALTPASRTLLNVGRPGALLRPAALRTRTCTFPRIRLKQAAEGPWARRRTIRSPSSESSAGPFTTIVVAAPNLSVGSGVVVIFVFVAHLTASAPFRARARGPGSGRLSGATSGGLAFRAFRTYERRPGWVPPIPRGRRCSSRTEGRAQPAPAARRRPVLAPRSGIHRAGLRFTRHRRGFKQFTRPVFPSPVAPRMARAALGLDLFLV
jgi:hypothetical protein